MNTNGRTRDPREIEAELDWTRAQMGNTLDKLQRKLSPGELFDQALNYLRANGTGELSSTLKSTIVRNPVPVALVGLGLAWMLMSGRRGSAPVPAFGPDMEDTIFDDETPTGTEFGGATPTVAEELDQGSSTSMEAGASVYGGSPGNVTGPSDEVSRGMDEGSPSSGRTGPSMAGGPSSPSGPSDEVAAGLDSAVSSSGKTSSGTLSGGSSNTTGPSDAITKGLDEAAEKDSSMRTKGKGFVKEEPR